MEQGRELELRKLVTPECVFGAGARRLAANYAVNFGARKVLVVTDPGVEAVGWTDDVTGDLQDAGLPHVIFDKVTPNPRSQEVMSGAEFYRAEGCDCIIAVGGGSPLDCAKGIGIVSTNHRDILEFEGANEVRIAIPPLICIPTTGGSSADVSQFAIINDTVRRVKIAIISKAIVPDVSLADPVTLTSMPADLAVVTGMDTFTHAFEAYVSTAASAVTDLFALEAIRLLVAYLVPSIEDPQNVTLKKIILDACLYAGLAFSNAGLGLVHSMAHSLGAYLDTPHGESNARLLPHVISFNFPAASDRYRKIAETIGIDTKEMTDEVAERALVSAVNQFEESIGITAGLAESGVSKDHIPDIAANAIDDPDIVTNPRRPSVKDIEDIYERAL